MSEQQLQRIQFVTTYYDWVQGLRFVPLGVVYLGFAAWLALPTPEGVDAKMHLAMGILVMLGASVLAMGCYALLGPYYRRRFGEVRRSVTTNRRMNRALGVSVVAGLVVGALTVVLHKSMQANPAEPPVVWILSVSAVGLAWYWQWSDRVAGHYLGVAGGFVAMAVLHAMEANPVYALLRALPFTSEARAAGVTLSGMWGLAVVVMGVMDHRLLVRTLGHEPEPESEEVPG
ncbi:hypothetical protein F0U59_07340 [Archangium gephyra]|nr:hypothetical protein F0U59_07340 [Archangium gephyra]